MSDDKRPDGADDERDQTATGQPATSGTPASSEPSPLDASSRPPVAAGSTPVVPRWARQVISLPSGSQPPPPAVGAASGSPPPAGASRPAEPPRTFGGPAVLPPPVPSAPAVREEDIPAGARFETAILGPYNSGKTYLFQALMYRLHQHGQQGVTARYLESVALWRKRVTQTRVSQQVPSDPSTHIDYNKGERKILSEFNTQYRDWHRFENTKSYFFDRYTVQLTYRTGWLGRRKERLKLSFVDCAGEVHRQGPNGGGLATEVWKTYRDARVVVFCLPLWAAFPGGSPLLNRTARENSLNDFETIVEHYRTLRETAKTRVRIVLALTQADGVESGLQTLADRWIRSYLNDSRRHLKYLGSMPGPTQYLAAARSVSNYVAHEFKRAEEDRVSNIPDKLTFDGRRPWIIPVSAADGEVIAHRQQSSNPPVPAHVDLPLLLALCEAHNALM